MIHTSFYSEEELHRLGFRNLGRHVQISRYARFYGADKMELGDYVRIDDFCILSGQIRLGAYVHVSAYVALYGSMGIEFEAHTGISAHSTVYSAMDDFSGEYLIGPVHPSEMTHVQGGRVTVRRYSQIGAHSLIFPNLTIGEGVVVGACSMVRNSLPDWKICFGVPAKVQKERGKGLLERIRDLNP